jgi:GR25 family glycosyltransferase involved in LPS biosynthesis
MSKMSFHRFDDNNLLINDTENDYYLTKENKLLEVNNNVPKVNVYFNYFKSSMEKRNKEILYCLDKLISNKKIDKIYLLCSDEYLDKSNKKITKINFDFQPTFNDIFNIVNLKTKNNDLNIILNSDCFIDDDSVQLILNNINHQMVYCLSRWNISNTFPFKSKLFDVEFCQNAWCFLGKMVGLNCDFKMGTPSYDNVLANEFGKSYVVSNPSKEIKIYHYHLSSKDSNFDEKEKIRLPEPYKFIPSSYLEEQNKSVLNKFIDQVYVINLERRKDRLEHIKKEFDKFNILFKRFNAIDGKEYGDDVKSAQLACLRSHVGVIKDALKKGYDKIAVFEDDIILCDDFETRFEYYSKSIPKDWDMMYLGGAHFNNGMEVKPFVYKIDGIYGGFAMILNNKNGLFEKIIELTEFEKEPIDEYYCKMLTDFNIYVFVPFFVKTLKTVSDISDKKESFSYDLVDKYFKNIIDLSDRKNTIVKRPIVIKSKNVLNQFVDNVYCINLLRRKDKLSHIRTQFKKINLNFQLIEGVDGRDLGINNTDEIKSRIGCLRSHVNILQDAINNGYEKIAVFEDDIIFCDDFEARFEYYKQVVPDDWEIMYLGSDIPPLLTPISMVRFMVYRVWKSTGSFAMILSNKNGLFQKIIDVSKDEEKPIDVYIETLFPKIKAYVFLPFFVKLLETNSDISDKNNIEIINSRFNEKIEIPPIPSWIKKN